MAAATATALALLAKAWKGYKVAAPFIQAARTAREMEKSKTRELEKKKKEREAAAKKSRTESALLD